MPHRLSKVDLHVFKDISFQAIVYPTTGTSIGRLHDPFEWREPSPDIPFTIQRRQKYISQLIQGVSALHDIGVVHADLHPGNITLAPPTEKHMARLLAKTPLEHDVRLKDGRVPPPDMPHRVTEPEDMRFSPTQVNIIDFGYSFIPETGAFYSADVFPKGNPPPPELLRGDKRTNQPFQVDSWYLGQSIYFILAGGTDLFPSSIVRDGEGLLEEYRLGLEELRTGQDSLINKLPEEIKSLYLPVILGLLDMDPDKRPTIRQLSQDERLLTAADDLTLEDKTG